MKLALLAAAAFAGGCGVGRSVSPEPLQALAKPQAQPMVADVTGTYYFGDGLGVNCVLELKKDGQFTFSWHGCLGEYDKNNGPYHREADLVVLKPTRPNKREGFQGTATRFYPVPWGDRLYLIDEAQMLGFCSRVHRGWRGDSYDGRNAFYYMREGIEAVKAGSLKGLKADPVVPTRYKKYLQNSLCALVTQTLDKGRVKVDKGSDDGVTVGTMLATLQGTWLDVTEVNRHDCVCKVWNEKDKAPRPGTQLEAVGL